MANPVQGYFDSTSFTLDVNGFPIWNRAVGSEFMAKFAHTVLGDGAASVTTGGFQVVKKTGLTVTVKPYFICKNGYMMYQTGETDITFTSSASEQVFYIGARLDVANNHFTGDDVAGYTTFVSGTDLSACKLTITANAVAITDGMIEDLRYDPAYCGQLDEYHERGVSLLNELETQLAIVMADGIPDHASTHAAGQTDAITPAAIGAQAAMTANTDYVVPSTLPLMIDGGIYSGGVVTPQGSPNQTVAVSACVMITPLGVAHTISAVSALAADAANGSNPRIDIVYVSSAGVVTYLAGTAAGSPTQPATPANGVLLASVYRGTSDNTISTSDIVNKPTYIAPRVYGTTWTPTVTCESGSITSYTVNRAYYQKVGKIVTMQIDITITNKGTGAGGLLISLPIANTYQGAGFGRETAVGGYQLQGLIFNSVLKIVKYDNTTAIVTSGNYSLFGSYEVA